MPFTVRAFGGIALLLVLVLIRGPLNAVLRPLFDVILGPFDGLHPMVGLTVLAIPTTIGALVMFRETSDQDKLARIKDRIYAGLFEIRLFNDDLKAVFKAQGEVFGANFKYFANAMVPLVWMIGPFIFLTGQLQFHYGYQGVSPGEETLVRVELVDGWRDGGSVPVTGNPGRPEIRLEAPDGVKVESPAVWSAAKNQVTWRIAGETEGDYELGVRVGDRVYTKSLVVSDRRERRSPTRVAGGLTSFDDLLHPAERTIATDAPISAISVDYDEAGMTLELANWIWAFFLLTIVVGFAVKDRFGVTI